MPEEPRKRTEAQRKAEKKYKKTHVTQKNIELYHATDDDIIAFLQTIPNVQRYIKELIREDMEKRCFVMPPRVKAGLIYSDPDSTYKVLRITGSDVMVEDIDPDSPNCGKKYGTTLEEVEAYL